MSWVTALSSAHQVVLLLHACSMVDVHLVALLEHVVHAVLQVRQVHASAWCPACSCMNGIELCSSGVPSGRVMDCTRPTPGLVEHRLGDPVDAPGSRPELRRSWSALDHQHLGAEPRRGEMPFGRGEAFGWPGCPAAGSAGRCSRCCTRAAPAVRSGTARSSPPGSGPGQRTIAAPMRRQNRIRMARLGSNSPKWLATVITAGPSVSAATTTTSMPMTAGCPSSWNRAAGEVQAEHRAGDGQAGAEDDVRGAVEHRVVGGLPSSPLLPRLLISAEQEDHVVGAGGDRQHGQQVDRERRQPDQAGNDRGRPPRRGRRPARWTTTNSASSTVMIER